MARTPGALGRDNPEYIKQLEDKKTAIKKKADEEIANINAEIKAATELRAQKLAKKLIKAGKTDKEIDEFLLK